MKNLANKIVKRLIKKKRALPLCGDKEISFDQIELFSKNMIKNFFKYQKKNNIFYYYYYPLKTRLAGLHAARRR